MNSIAQISALPGRDYLPLITTILAIASGLGPIMFGFVLWKMQGIFVTKENFNEYKVHAESERSEMKSRLTHIEENTLELLQRTAPKRDRERER